MTFREVEACIHQFLDTGDLIVQAYPAFPYGKKLIDSFGDFIIFFYDTRRKQVMYCFKDAEKYWFPCDSKHGIKLNS